MKQKLCMHFCKSWLREKGHTFYDIHLLPSISIFYDSVMDNIDEPESPQVTIQWLIWKLTFWFEEVKKCS